MSGETPVRRNRSACGPTYFGPGKSGVAAEYGQKLSQIVHFTQWSRESRASSVTGAPSGFAVNRAHALVDRDTRTGDCVLGEVALFEVRPIRVRDSRHGQVEDSFSDLSGRVELQAA